MSARRWCWSRGKRRWRFCRRKIVFPSSAIWRRQTICQTHLVTRHPSLVTFFGMIPNFEPQQFCRNSRRWCGPKDFLLFSANLAPGNNYAAGMKKVLPQYDNPLTRDWLLTFLFDLGVEHGDGRLRFKIETARRLETRSPRISFSPRAARSPLTTEQFDFRRGESIQLFFSYRYTPARVRKMLGKSRSGSLRRMDRAVRRRRRVSLPEKINLRKPQVREDGILCACLA